MVNSVRGVTKDAKRVLDRHARGVVKDSDSRRQAITNVEVASFDWAPSSYASPEAMVNVIW